MSGWCGFYRLFYSIYISDLLIDKLGFTDYGICFEIEGRERGCSVVSMERF